MATLTTAMKGEAAESWRAREAMAVHVRTMVLPDVNRYEVDLGVPQTTIPDWQDFGAPNFQVRGSPLVGQTTADYLAKLDYFSWQAFNNVEQFVSLVPDPLPTPWFWEAMQDYNNSPIPDIDLPEPATQLLMQASVGPKKGTIIGGPGQGTHSYSDRPNNWQSDHAVDIRMPKGTPILAVADGVVCSGCGFGPHGGGDRYAGERLTLNYGHEMGRSAYYAHLSRITVSPGDRVRRGQVIGYSGIANKVPHLHFATDKFDPLKIVKSSRVKPWR